MQSDKTTKAIKFLYPHRHYYCSLLEKIVNKEDDVFIVEDTLSQNDSTILGVYSYTSGDAFTGCFDLTNQKAHLFLSDFFGSHNIFCITGKFEDVKFYTNLILSFHPETLVEERIMHLMKFDKSRQKYPGSNHEIVRLTDSNIERVMPLHCGFMKEEVIPSWKEVNLCAERMKLQRLLSKKNMWGIRAGNAIVAKIHVLNQYDDTVIVGGVYTLKEFRNKGCARSLAAFAAEFFCSKNIDCCLYVKKNNPAAICAYSNAGFVVSGEFGISYFN